MKRLYLSLSLLLLSVSFFTKVTFAQTIGPTQTLPLPDQIPPIPCNGVISCPNELQSYYASKNPPESCATSYSDFVRDPIHTHYWAEDPQITAQGKADERARQFIYWVLNNNSIDNHPAIREIWNTTRNIAYFMTIFIVGVMGLGFIIGQRANFQLKLKFWPNVMKIGLILLYITFSASILLLMIQLSEVLMKFFIESYGGKDLFNIYFSGSSSQEKNYIDFVGCRDLNFRVQESVNAEVFLLKLTNITYYIMGSMLILRKVLLWFMIFVSPFLALLMPFTFIRNIGWIWIGVFFQWLFYGPLFALFLGSLAKIWKSGIPFAFDFGRANTPSGYIYPTAINLLYGGPAQRLTATNTGNYVDTFAEYVITLIMLWAVTFFPWWLLRIFRDYCCDGIMAMKNILLSMYDQMRTGPSPSPTPGPTPMSFNTPTKINTDINISRDIQNNQTIRMENIEQIRQAKTTDITKSLNLHVSNLTDIAKFETNTQSQKQVIKNLSYLSNPTKADTPKERQMYMNIRNELFNRAVKQDTTARQILSATSSSAVERISSRQNLITSTTNNMQPITHVISIKVNIPETKVQSTISSAIKSIANNPTYVKNISQSVMIPPPMVTNVLTTYSQNISKPVHQIISTTSNTTNVPKEKVSQIMKKAGEYVKDKEIQKQVQVKEQIDEKSTHDILEKHSALISAPDQYIEQAIALPNSVSIEDYEEVKKMWMNQYEKGEVPTSENVMSRAEWIEQDIVFITNSLNKLLSSDEKLKQEALDEIGFILPIFMINNFKGDELLVYLKAKLEAAKAVKEQIEKERIITDRLTPKQEEDLVDVAKPAVQQKEKEMHLEQHMYMPEDKPIIINEKNNTTENQTPQKPQQVTHENEKITHLEQHMYSPEYRPIITSEKTETKKDQPETPIMKKPTLKKNPFIKQEENEDKEDAAKTADNDQTKDNDDDDLIDRQQKKEHQEQEQEMPLEESEDTLEAAIEKARKLAGITEAQGNQQSTPPASPNNEEQPKEDNK